MSATEGFFFYYSNIDYNSLFDRLNRTSDALEQFKEPPSNHLQILFTTTQNPNMSRITIFGDDFGRNPILILFLAVAAFGHLIAYIIVLVCAHLMLQTLQKKSGQMSFQARMSHEVLVHAVFAEAFIPLTFTVPILANSLLCYFYTDSLEWQEFLPEYFIGVVPLLTPIISIVFIKPYRNVALNFFTLGRREKNQAAARDKTAQDREDAQAARDIMEMNLAE
ncbi:unnamed protein product, partial [Mesorhabditis spiculigera]